MQRELLSLHALRLSCGQDHSVGWRIPAGAGPQWHKDSDTFILTWGSEEFARKRQKPRGKWFAADFQNPSVSVRRARCQSDSAGVASTGTSPSRMPLSP